MGPCECAFKIVRQGSWAHCHQPLHVVSCCGPTSPFFRRPPLLWTAASARRPGPCANHGPGQPLRGRVRKCWGWLGVLIGCGQPAKAARDPALQTPPRSRPPTTGAASDPGRATRPSHNTQETGRPGRRHASPQHRARAVQSVHRGRQNGGRGGVGAALWARKRAYASTPRTNDHRPLRLIDRSINKLNACVAGGPPVKRPQRAVHWEGWGLGGWLGLVGTTARQKKKRIDAVEVAQTNQNEQEHLVPARQTEASWQP